MSNEYVLTDTIIHPLTKNNIDTYIVKDNISVSFSVANHEIDIKSAVLSNYYYRSYKNKNIIIHCMEKVYLPGTVIPIANNSNYVTLQATKKLADCIIVYDFKYTVLEEDKEIEKHREFYFKVVSDKQYEMYKSMIKVPNENGPGEIKRPKKQE